MSILNDKQIRKWAQYSVVPYCSKRINPASIDLTLSDMYVDLYDKQTRSTSESKPLVLYPPSMLRDWLYEINKVLCKLTFRRQPEHRPTSILAMTEELVYFPEDMAGDIKLKTTPARKGLNHTLAGWVDPGYMGKLTLTLHASHKVELKPGQPICQLILHKLDEPCEVSYRQVGHYMNQLVPTPAKDISYE